MPFFSASCRSRSADSSVKEIEIVIAVPAFVLPIDDIVESADASTKRQHRGGKTGGFNAKDVTGQRLQPPSSVSGGELRFRPSSLRTDADPVWLSVIGHLSA